MFISHYARATPIYEETFIQGGHVHTSGLGSEICGWDVCFTQLVAGVLLWWERGQSEPAALSPWDKEKNNT